MRFSRLDTAIALAKKEAAALAAIDPRLQSFVVGYLVVDIVSEFEVRLETMFSLRAKKLGDIPNANFIAKILDRKFRSPDVGKINQFLRDHDDAWLRAFENLLTATKWQSAMANLMLNRHYFVHKSGNGPTMSLQDVENAYNEAVQLFTALATTLGLSAADCAQLT